MQIMTFVLWHMSVEVTKVKVVVMPHLRVDKQGHITSVVVFFCDGNATKNTIWIMFLTSQSAFP